MLFYLPVLLLVFHLTYPVLAEKATPHQTTVEIRRTLKPASQDKLTLICGERGKCKIEKVTNDRKVAEGELPRQQAIKAVVRFLSDLPKEDVKKEWKENTLIHSEGLAMTWYATDGSRTASGQLTPDETTAIRDKKFKSFAQAFAKLEFLLLRSIKSPD